MERVKRSKFSRQNNTIWPKIKILGPWREDYQLAGKSRNGLLLSTPSILSPIWERGRSDVCIILIIPICLYTINAVCMELSSTSAHPRPLFLLLALCVLGFRFQRKAPQITPNTLESSSLTRIHHWVAVLINSSLLPFPPQVLRGVQFHQWEYSSTR